MASTATMTRAPLTEARRPAARRGAARWAELTASVAFWSLVAGYVAVFCDELMACAARVPTLRKRCLPAGGLIRISVMSSSGRRTEAR